MVKVKVEFILCIHALPKLDYKQTWRFAVRKPRFEVLENRRVLATLVVNSASDFSANNDNGLLTIREAVAIINETYDPQIPSGDLFQINTKGGTEPLGTNDNIVFHPDVFGRGLNREGQPKTDTIHLLRGELAITRSVIIDGAGLVDVLVDGVLTPTPGPGWLDLTINASLTTGNTPSPYDGSRVFNIYANGDVTIRELSVTGGDAGSGGGILAGASPSSDVLLENLYIYGNRAYGEGGGLALSASADSVIEVSNVIVDGNSLFDDGYAHTPVSGAGVSLTVEGPESGITSGRILIDTTVIRNNSSTDKGAGGGGWLGGIRWDTSAV